MLNKIQEKAFISLKEKDYESAVGFHTLAIKNDEYIDAMSKVICENEDYKSIKTRYYECLVDMVHINKQEDLLDRLYKNKYWKEIRSNLFLNPITRSLFKDRIIEYRKIFKKIEKIPFLTKKILMQNITDTATDEKLFTVLQKVTPLYFLRKMQMPSLIVICDMYKYIHEKHIDKKLNVLDYGCGAADSSIFLALKGHKVTICDVDGGNLDAAKKRFQLRKLTVDTYSATAIDPIPKDINEKFDLIIANEIIEHIRTPKTLLTLFNQILKEDGSIQLGSFPFVDTNAVGDHLVEAISKKNDLLQYINRHWQKDRYSKELPYFFLTKRSTLFNKNRYFLKDNK